MPAAALLPEGSPKGQTLDLGAPGQHSYGPLHVLAIRLTVLAVLIIYSRLSESIAMALGFNPYLVLILSAAAFVLMIPTGGLARGLLSRTGLLLTAFTLWLMLVTPFSVWKGGSAQLLKDYWSKAFVLFLILAGLLLTAEHCRRVLYALAAAAIVVVSMALLEGVSSQQRLDFGRGSFANPNDLAFYLAFSLPGCILLAMNSRPFSFRRAVGFVSAGLLCVLIFRTGSRMGVLMMCAALLFQFLASTLAGKAKLLTAGMLLGAIAIVTTGDEVRARYRTIFGDPGPQFDPTGEIAKAQGSTYARKNLLRAGLVITLQNPIVGVGPGMFQVAAADDPYTAKVLFAAWKETHNAYLQVSSEAGIPGCLLYVGIVASVCAALLRVWRRSRKRKEFELHFRLAHSLMLMLIIFLVGSMFGSSAYNFFLPTLAGLAVALDRSFRMDEFRLLDKQATVSPRAFAAKPASRLVRRPVY